MSRLVPWLLFLLLLSFGVVTWATNNAPALNAPLGPELLGVGVGLILVVYGWRDRSRPTSSGRSSQFSIYSVAMTGLTALTICTLVRAIASFIQLEQVHPLCTAMPGLIQQVECIFQAATNQNFGLRTASYFITALILFAGSSLASRRSPQLIAIAVFALSALFGAVTLIMHYSQLHLSPMLESLFAGDFRDSRMCYLMGNPTWITPYLAPGLMIGAAFLLNKSVRLLPKILAATIVLMMLYLQLRTQQRGSLLVVGLYVGTLGLTAVFALVNRIRKKPLSPSSSIVIAGVSVALYGLILYVSYEPVSRLLASWGFGDRLASTSWASSERSAIWQGARSGMPGHWWFGHGYGTWYREGAPLAAKFGFNDVLDTAHNFFVQVGFELGALQLFGLLICVSLLLVHTWLLASNRSLAAKMLGVVVAIYLPILLVQEIDFVRSVYMINALGWGWVVADGFAIKSPQRAEISSKSKVRILGVLALVCFGCAFLTTRLFSLAGYQYEANSRTGFQPMVRWLRPNGTLTFVDRKAAQAGLYAVYSMPQLNSARYSHTLAGSTQPESVARPSTGQSYLPIAARFLSRGPDLFDAPGFSLDNSRHISALLQWPPKLSMLPLRWSEGLFGWESVPALFGDAAVQWCGKTCSVRFSACTQGSQVRKLRLGAMRPDISAVEPLRVNLITPNNNDVTLISAQQLNFHAPDQIIDVNIPAIADLNLSVSRTFKPSQDTRELGVLLISGACL